ncbi:MAG: DMT family transporter [Geodermatophilaceae bacterium]|nr:DMT family transporter [Geodermatophilaceae bacterium]
MLLALGAALAYGASDFIGGRASTRVHYSVVAAVGAGVALVIAVVAAPLVGGVVTPGPLAWGVLAGLGSGLGTLFLYRGLARARVAVVAPTSGVLAAAMPAGLALLLGERPAPITVAGLVLALPAVWFISGGAGGGADDARPSGLLDGILAGLGFGLLFLALDQAGDSAGLWPLAAGQATAFVLLVPVARKLSRPASQPAVAAGTEASDHAADATNAGIDGAARSAARPRPWLPMALATGVLGSVAILLFYASTTIGLLTVAAVLTSLYPAGTILLARIVLDERITRRQGIGLALAGCAVVLITLG